MYLSAPQAPQLTYSMVCCLSQARLTIRCPQFVRCLRLQQRQRRALFFSSEAMCRSSACVGFSPSFHRTLTTVPFKFWNAPFSQRSCRPTAGSASDFTGYTSHFCSPTHLIKICVMVSNETTLAMQPATRTAQSANWLSYGSYGKHPPPPVAALATGPVSV